MGGPFSRRKLEIVMELSTRDATWGMKNHACWRAITRRKLKSLGSRNVCNLQVLKNLFSRGALVGDEYSGWLVLEIDSIKEGLIILKVDPWLAASKEPIPSNWTSGNRDGRNLKGYNIVDQSEQMVFEYAINGNITSIPWKEFRPALKKVQRTVYLVTLLDDPGFQGENVEVGIRMRDCGRKCRYGISHVYYA